MTTRRLSVLLPLLAGLAGLALAGAAAADSHEAQIETVAVGGTLPALSLEDQHGELHTLDASTRLVIFTREMDAGDIVKEVLAERGGEILAAQGAIYVADVHRMPGLIRRLFALPSMRRRPYPMWLDVEGEATAVIPAVEGKPTLLFVENREVKEIRNPDSVEELRAALGLAADRPVE